MEQVLPVALKLSGVPVLVVGGGRVAARKAVAFLECGAEVRGLAPSFGADWPEGAERVTKKYQVGDCAGYGLVVAATDDSEVNEAVCREAKGLGIWCNDVSDPEGGRFISSAVLRRGPIAIGVNTGGASPVLAAHLRDMAAAAIGPEYERLMELAADCKLELQHRGEFWRRLLASDVLEHLRQGRETAAQATLDTLSEEILKHEL